MLQNHILRVDCPANPLVPSFQRIANCKKCWISGLELRRRLVGHAMGQGNPGEDSCKGVRCSTLGCRGHKTLKHWVARICVTQPLCLLAPGQAPTSLVLQSWLRLFQVADLDWVFTRTLFGRLDRLCNSARRPYDSRRSTERCLLGRLEVVDLIINRNEHLKRVCVAAATSPYLLHLKSNSQVGVVIGMFAFVNSELKIVLLQLPGTVCEYDSKTQQGLLSAYTPGSGQKEGS